MGLRCVIMSNRKFEVIGTFKVDEGWKPYTKVVEAPNENQVNERIYTIFGSKHRLPRRCVRISGIKLVDGE